MSTAHLKRLSVRISLILFSLIMALFSFPHAHIASADYASLCGGFTRLGRDGCHGYFTNQNFYSTFIEGWNLLNCQLSARGCITINGTTESPNYVFPSGINNATLFENEIGYYLNTGYTYNHLGAAFIIDTMLGKTGSSFGSDDAGINYAVANFNNWKTNYVDYYASKGWITWNQSTTLAAGTINTMHVCSYNYDCTQSDIGSHDGKDIVFFRNPPSEAAHLIVFHNPDGSSFQIRRECGNVVGNLPNMNPLTKMPPPVATAACDGFTSDVLTPDPNRAFNLTASVNINPDSSAPGMFGPDSMKVALAGPAPYAGVSVTDTTPSIASGEVSTVLHVPPTNVSGTFTVTWSITGSTAPTVSCSDTIDVAYIPYFTARGGDISAGQGFGNSCTDNPGAEIDGENLDSGSSPANYFGAGTSNAAIATGNISQFATNTTNNVPSNLGGSSDGLSVNQPSGLAFSNSVPSGAEYGGDALGSWPGTWCVPDYVTSADAPTGAFNPANLVSGTYTLTSSTLGGFTVPAGAHITVIASAGVYINGDIKFAGYGNLGQVPKFTLLVKGGDIYINNNVKELHGFYDAEPDAAAVGGNIFTCATALGTASTDYATCNVPLTFYGAVASSQIVPGRTRGDITKGVTVTDVPAEQFVYTPEMWLGAVTTPTVTCMTNPTQPSCMYQAYTTLPPVL